MNQSDIELAVKEQPFTPIELHLSNGAVYRVTHPDGILISKRVSAVSVGDSIKLIANIHINSIETVVGV
jgi:hypothetical protein